MRALVYPRRAPKRGLDVSAHLASLFDLTKENFFLENISFLATTFGLLILLISYVSSRRAEDRRREVGTYDSLETQYVAFQRLALQHPKLDVADAPIRCEPIALSPEEEAQRDTLYMILFSLFERAFLLYQPGPFGGFFVGHRRWMQWKSWESYILRYLEREGCRAAWFNHEPPKADVRQDFDDDFERFVMRLMKKRGWV